MLEVNKIYNMDCVAGMKLLDNNSVDCCVTSPPYFGLRNYGNAAQIGLEVTPEEYVAKIVEVFREVKRVLRDDGTLWLNIGDSYNANYRGGGFENASVKQISNAGSVPFMATKKKPLEGIKSKDLVGIPWMVAFALRTDGWYLRQDIIWAKTNPMPESVKDRCTKSHEYIFLLSKSPNYYYDADAIKETVVDGDGVKNKRDVWAVAIKPIKDAHFATFPPKLIEPCILSGCPIDGIVLDPFMGSGTTGMVAMENKRNYIGFELSSEYCGIAERRIKDLQGRL